MVMYLVFSQFSMFLLFNMNHTFFKTTDDLLFYSGLHTASIYRNHKLRIVFEGIGNNPRCAYCIIHT